MPVSASLIALLETNNITYQLKASHLRLARRQAPEALQSEACSVQSWLMQDSSGYVHLLLPSDRILDLGAIQSQFGRALTAIPPEEITKLMTDHQLHGIPAIPGWQGYMTFVDASLLSHQTLWLDAGDSDEMLEVEMADFQNMMGEACLAEISAEAPQVPTDIAEDKSNIVHSLKQFTSLRIKERLEETLELPPLPETAQRIIQLRSDPESDISDLSDIVELDPSLAAQVVSWASSPYYSAPGKIKSVHDAIVRVLGFDMVMNLALGLALGKSFKNSVITSHQIKTYWENAVTTAAVVEGLVTSMPREHRPGFGLAYLSGLMHDFGYLIMADTFPPYFANLSRHYDANPHISPASVEQHLIGVSSCQVSSWLLGYWHMPEEVVTALRHQHNPNYDGEHAVYANLLYVANHAIATNKTQLHTHSDAPDALFDSLQLDRATAEKNIENVVHAAEDLNAIAAKMRG